MRAPAALLMMAACALGQVTGTVRDSMSGLPVEGVKITMAGRGATPTSPEQGSAPQ